jgi:uncharacterized damage-inducible protein DinB
MDRSIITSYAEGGPVLAHEIAGLSHEQFLATPVPGTWSIQQIVLHLMDSDLIASDRMKRIIAEDDPAIIGYNERAFASRLFYDQQDPFLAAQIFEKNRQLTTVILRSLPDAAFARCGTHNQRGKVTLAEMVAMYVDHLEHHLKFLRHKRQLLGV